MNYSEKLKSPKWQKKRLEVLNRDNFTCCKCGDTETELHVHHLKYTKEPYDAPLNDLETLCKHCHYYFTFYNKEVLEFYEIDEIISIVKTKFCLLINSKELIIMYHLIEDNPEFVIAFKKNGGTLKEIFKLL